MAERTVNYIEPEVLAARLLGEVASERELVVVDVRDDDFDERVIRGALHVPSAEFPERVDEVLSAHSHGKDVVFHCSLSQVGLFHLLRVENSFLFGLFFLLLLLLLLFFLFSTCFRFPPLIFLRSESCHKILDARPVLCTFLRLRDER